MTYELNLLPVIQWLDAGCDPKEAAKELRIHQSGIDAAHRAPGAQPEPAAPTVALQTVVEDGFVKFAIGNQTFRLAYAGDDDLLPSQQAAQLEWMRTMLHAALSRLAATPPRAALTLTDDAVRRAARVLSDRTADACGIDREDEWKTYFDSHIDDARAALEAAHGIAADRGQG